MAEQYLTLNPSNKAGVFNRSVRDDKGKIVDQITFQTGVFVNIDSISRPMQKAICDDIGNQIMVAVPNEHGVTKISRERTDQLVLEIAEAKADKKIPLTRHQASVVEAAEKFNEELERKLQEDAELDLQQNANEQQLAKDAEEQVKHDEPKVKYDEKKGNKKHDEKKSDEKKAE